MLRARLEIYDAPLLRTMNDIAPHAREYGDKFLDVVRDRERDNPRFEFLRDETVRFWMRNAIPTRAYSGFIAAAFVSVLCVARRPDLRSAHRGAAFQRRSERAALHRVTLG